MTRRTLLFSGVALALRQGKLDEAARLIETQTKSGEITAAALHVQAGKEVLNRGFGKAPDANAVFLRASITKPMTCTAVMRLSDRKELSIDDPVRKYLPEFFGGDRDRVLIRHLVTHSSGLPDMLPENDELRKKHATLKHFVASSCRTPL